MDTERKSEPQALHDSVYVAPLALLFTFTYLPFAEMVNFSFYDMKSVGERTFVRLRIMWKYFREKTASMH